MNRLSVLPRVLPFAPTAKETQTDQALPAMNNVTVSKSMFSRNVPMHSALALALLALTGMAQAQDAQLQPQAERISQAAIHADHDTYTATQGPIKALNDKGIRVDNYHLAKAQCWLDTSFHEYTRNDRGGYPQAALDESVKLITALEAGTDPGWETPLVNGAEKLRPDLWAKYDSLKKMEGFSCAAQATACAEVELVHAGNEIHDGGWRHAKPYIQIAEDLTAKAERREAECKQPEPQPVTEQFDLAADALFKFDRGDLAGMLPEGRAKLDELVARLNSVYANVERIRLVGHTDRLGSDAYNQKLSDRRAWTVKQYLQDQGISAAVQAEGVGESQPTGTTSHCLGERATRTLTQCLQPDRRVSVEITGVKRQAK